MATTTIDVPIDLAAGEHTIEVQLESGYSLRLVGGASVLGLGLVVAVPADYDNVAFPLPCAGACVPYDSVRIFNDDTNELVATVYADSLGAWSTSLPSA